MPELKVNGKPVEFTAGMTVLQACELAGEEIPRFCYHERLNIAGNCRMCLVEIKGGPPKPAASCAMPAAENMEVFTQSDMVKKAREGVMEFLLMNHPLDCPICDQGGECDLQDQALAYGRCDSRFEEDKRAVKEKYMGPLIKTHMTRCIHCTRCIRFMDEVAGVHELGAVARGENMQVTTYVEKSLSSELSGNIVDLCPVGALTSAPYAHKARPWELRKTETVDVMDGVCSAVRVDVRGREILRVQPRLDEDVNEEWISDKTRFAFDGLKVQRLDRAYVRDEQTGKLTACSVGQAQEAAAALFKAAGPGRSAVVAGPFTDMETMFAGAVLARAAGTANIDCRFDGSREAPSRSGSYRMHVSLPELEKADAILMVGAYPRFEAPLLNARIRKAWLRNGAKIAYIGSAGEHSYPVMHLGTDMPALQRLADGRSSPFCEAMETAKHPVVILGGHMLIRPDAETVEYLCYRIADRFKTQGGVNVLYDNAARVGGTYLRFLPPSGALGAFESYAACQRGALDTLLLLGVDDYVPRDLGRAKVIYVGHHGDAGAARADVILPGCAYTEKASTYLNVEGRVRITRKAMPAPGDAREDSILLTEIASMLSGEEGFNSAAEIHEALFSQFPEMAAAGEGGLTVSPFVAPKESRMVSGGGPFAPRIHDFYRTDVISRHSKIMAQCSRAKQGTEAA